MKISNLVPAHPPEKYTLCIKNTFPTSFLPSILIRFELHSGEKKMLVGEEERGGVEAKLAPLLITKLHCCYRRQVSTKSKNRAEKTVLYNITTKITV